MNLLQRLATDVLQQDFVAKLGCPDMFRSVRTNGISRPVNFPRASRQIHTHYYLPGRRTPPCRSENGTTVGEIGSPPRGARDRRQKRRFMVAWPRRASPRGTSLRRRWRIASRRAASNALVLSKVAQRSAKPLGFLCRLYLHCFFIVNVRTLHPSLLQSCRRRAA